MENAEEYENNEDVGEEYNGEGEEEIQEIEGGEEYEVEGGEGEDDEGNEEQ